MVKKRILSFFGTRPEAIKMAPVILALERSADLESIVVLSAQHRSMLDQVMDLFGLSADEDLNLMKRSQTLSDITEGVLRLFGAVLDRVKPDLVLVHGDTTTTFSGALAASYRKIPVGHVEAGLRSGDRSQPFPEEINRVLTDSLSSIYFAPTPGSCKNLLREHIDRSRIFVTGNTVIDALFNIAKQQVRFENARLKKVIHDIENQGHKMILMTAHRRENFGAPLRAAFQSVKNLSKQFPHVHWIYPVHPNPNVLDPAKRILGRLRNVHLFEPLGYSDLVHVMKQSTLVLTDSGGLQEEAPSLGKPVLVMRDVTERPEAVKAGTVRLVGTDPNKISRQVTQLLSEPNAYRKMANSVNPYGDGRASERIVQALRCFLGLSSRLPEAFCGH